jgi:hypothetical protein
MTSTETPGAPASVTIPDGTSALAITSAYDTPFRQRLSIIAPLVALAIVAEDPTTLNHAARAAYARQVLADPVTIVNRSICFLAVADGATSTGSTDQNIANRLGDIWNTLSYGFA